MRRIIVHYRKVKITQIFAKIFLWKCASLIYFMSENRVLFRRIYFISRAIQAWKSAERCSSLPLFFHDRRISRQFLSHLHHVLSCRKKLSFFFSRAKLLFHDCRFRDRRLASFRKVCLPISARALREFTMYYRHYIESARSHRENRWTVRRVGWRELSCEKKRDKADRPPHQWWWR